MAKYIGIIMLDLEPMTAEEAYNKNYLINMNALNKNSNGYEVTYENGDKTWVPSCSIDNNYFKLEDKDGDKISSKDIINFTDKIESITIGDNTTNTTITCITGFKIHGQSSCVNPDNYDINIGKTYAKHHAEDKLWEYLGFILKWAKNGIKFNNKK